MANPFTQLVILVSTGGTTAAVNVTIGLPPAASTDPFDVAPGVSPQQKPGIAGIVNGIVKVGFWDSAGVYHGPAQILQIVPQ